jgi:hypothetical protein
VLQKACEFADEREALGQSLIARVICNQVAQRARSEALEDNVIAVAAALCGQLAQSNECSRIGDLGLDSRVLDADFAKRPSCSRLQRYRKRSAWPAPRVFKKITTSE